MSNGESITELIQRVLIKGKPNPDVPFEVLLNRQLVELAPHVYDDRAGWLWPDIMLTDAGMDVLDKPGGLEAVLFEELQSIADAECFHYEMEDLGCAPFTNEPIPPVTMVTTFVAGCAPTTKTHK